MPDATKPQILIIEDNHALAALYQEILNDAGYDADSCYSREAAMKRLEVGYAPSLVLVDCMMPGMSTTDFRDQVRALAHGSTLKLVAFSCLSAESPLAREIAGMLDGFAEKPDDIDEVVAIARRYCEN